MSAPTKMRAERLAEFYSRLRALPAPCTADEALAQIGSTLDDVEDAYSGVAKKDPPPPPNMPDGRMYPPLPDRTDRHPDGSITAETRGHLIEIAANGSITMSRRHDGIVEFQKLGGGP